MKYKLYRWSVVMDPNPYLAPECRASHLSGYRDQEKEPIITSPIDKVNGREITTKSGSVYLLEDIDPNYMQYLVKTNYPFDPDNPIKPAKDESN